MRHVEVSQRVPGGKGLAEPAGARHARPGESTVPLHHAIERSPAAHPPIVDVGKEQRVAHAFELSESFALRGQVIGHGDFLREFGHRRAKFLFHDLKGFLRIGALRERFGVLQESLLPCRLRGVGVECDERFHPAIEERLPSTPAASRRCLSLGSNMPW